MTAARLPVVAAAFSVIGLCLPGLAQAIDLDKPVSKQSVRAGAAAPAAPAAPAGAAAPAKESAAAEDAMERLRQRLAGRLANPAGGPASGTVDLQVSTRGAGAAAAPRAGGSRPASPSAEVAAAAPLAAAHTVAPAAATAHRVAAPLHAAAAPAPAAGGTVRRAQAAHASAHAVNPHWAYEGNTGPAAWGGLRPEFNLCANGQRQSPIDIRGGLAVDLDPVKFDYRPSGFSVIDNGHTVQVNVPPGNAIEVAGRRFELVQFHFHRPSEERIDGRQFEMSLHLVHKDSAGKLAVVGVLLGRGPAHPAVQTVWNNLPLERGEEARARAQLDPAHLLPADKRYYTYMGSLTTPPCSEGVLWVVMRTPVTLTEEQIELFARIYPMNARPAQPVAGRRIMQSQ